MTCESRTPRSLEGYRQWPNATFDPKRPATTVYCSTIASTQRFVHLVHQACYSNILQVFLLNPLIPTLKPDSNGVHTTVRWLVHWPLMHGLMGCYIWYSEEGTGRAMAPPSPLLAVPNVTAHPSTDIPGRRRTAWIDDVWRRTGDDMNVARTNAMERRYDCWQQPAGCLRPTTYEQHNCHWTLKG